MQIDAFMLAEAARAAHGRLFIHGGGLVRIVAPLLPWTHPQIALVARFETGAEEMGEEQEIAFTIVDPDDRVLLPRWTMTIQPQRESEADQLGFANVAVTVSPITFYRPGLHDVHLELTSETRTIKLEVQHAPDDDDHAGQFVEVNP